MAFQPADVLTEVAEMTQPRFSVKGMNARGYVAKKPRKKLDPIERFLAKVDKSGGPDACWPWSGGMRFEIGQKPDPKRKGKTTHDAVSFRMFMWKLTFGEYPPKKLFPEKCGNGRCCNPAHMGFHYPPLIGDTRLRMTDYMDTRKRKLALVQPKTEPKFEPALDGPAEALAIIVKALDRLTNQERRRVLAATNAFFAETGST